ncbi:MAG: hypothetical protein ACREQB_08745 [Candidatus Binataceae bacterium]
MESDSTTPGRGRRLIAIAAGVITVGAIVAAFGAEYLELPSLRPIAEIIILAELVGLVVLERRQIFEPVHDAIRDLQGRFGALEQLRDELAAAGSAQPYSNRVMGFQAGVSVMREALTRDPGTPQILRTGRMSGTLRPVPRSDAIAEDDRWQRDFISAIFGFCDTPANRSTNPWVHLWTVRMLFVVADGVSFDAISGAIRELTSERPSNLTVKLLLRSVPEPALSPTIVGEQTALVAFEDYSTPMPHWQIFFRGKNYVPLFARWFDEFWHRNDAYTIYSHGEIDEREFERARTKLGDLNRAAAAS